jgi:hypothetical protein
MKRMFACLLLVTVSISAQTVAPPAASPNPQYLIGFGASYNKYAATPTAAGWVTAAVATSQDSGIYSITTIDMTQTSSSLRTGIAKLLLQNGNWTLMAHADGGITTGTLAGTVSAVTLGSFSGGGLVLYDLGGVWKKAAGVKAIGVLRVLAITSAAIQPVFEFGIGKTF